jgi:ABC-2 type transport system permease protein
MNRQQLQAMLLLRWQLSRNQWRRGGELNAVLMVIILCCGLCLSLIGGVGGLLAGIFGLSEGTPFTFMFAWDGLIAVFLVFWTVGVITDLQKSEILDLSRFLHLPISLRGVFFLNYLASHFSASLAMLLPTMMGLTIGLIFGRGAAMALLLPLAFSFIFMVTAWTYCLRGWLASLMINKRRRRAIVMGITMAFILLVQLPNLLTNVYIFKRTPPPPVQNPEEFKAWAKEQSEENTKQLALFQQVHRYVPFLWLPLGAKNLAEGCVWPALLGFAGMSAIGSVGLFRAYRGTVRFYRGGETVKAEKVKPVGRKKISTGTLFVERQLPAIPEEAAAMALATLRSMSRAPEVKMMVATNLLIFTIVGAGMFLRPTGGFPVKLQSPAFQSMIGSGMVAVSMMGLAGLMFNHFGFDRTGFRALVLLPVPRRRILLGKNLALLPVALTTFLIYLGLATALAHLGAWAIFSAALEFVAAFFGLSALGNLLSTVVPYRIAAGSLKPTKMKLTTQLMIMITNFSVLPAGFALIFLPSLLGLICGESTGSIVALICAALWAFLAALLYWLTLEPLGKLLQRREQKILQIVTQEVE